MWRFPHLYLALPHVRHSEWAEEDHLKSVARFCWWADTPPRRLASERSEGGGNNATRPLRSHAARALPGQALGIALAPAPSEPFAAPPARRPPLGTPGTRGTVQKVEALPLKTAVVFRLSGTTVFYTVSFPARNGSTHLLRFAPVEPFRRGDANCDAVGDVSEAVKILLALFSGLAIPCLDAGDVNDDGILNLSDAVLLLSHLFRAGAQPPAPFPGCGLGGCDGGWAGVCGGVRVWVRGEVGLAGAGALDGLPSFAGWERTICRADREPWGYHVRRASQDSFSVFDPAPGRTERGLGITLPLCPWPRPTS